MYMRTDPACTLAFRLNFKPHSTIITSETERERERKNREILKKDQHCKDSDSASLGFLLAD